MASKSEVFVRGAHGVPVKEGVMSDEPKSRIVTMYKDSLIKTYKFPMKQVEDLIKRTRIGNPVKRAEEILKWVVENERNKAKAYW